MAEEASLEPHRRAALARLSRLRLSGRRVWIRNTGPAVDANQVEARLRSGKSVAQIPGELDVSRSTIYRILRPSQRGRTESELSNAP